MKCDLSEIGKTLKDVRERKGLSLDQASNMLSIEKPFLEGIESADWGKLPDPFYVQGYITEYAALLDVFDELRPRLVTSKDRLSPDAPATEPPAKTDGTLNGYGFQNVPIMAAIATGILHGSQRGQNGCVAPAGLSHEERRPESDFGTTCNRKIA